MATADRADGEASKDYESVRAELLRLYAQVDELDDRYRSILGEAERGRARISSLESDRQRLSNKVALAEWRLEALQSRRWWRLGRLLISARDPRRIARLPYDLIKELGRRPVPVARPRLPSTGDEATERQAGWRQYAQPPVPAPVPRIPLTVAAVVSDDLYILLAYEVQVFRLDEATWNRQLDDLAPQVVLVEFPHSLIWPRATISALAEYAAHIGVPAVAWSPDGEIGYAGDAGFRAQRVRGSIQPRLHNPVLTGPRSEHALVLPDGHLEGEVATDPWRAAYLPKHYQRVVVGEAADSRTLNRISATSTPLARDDADAEQAPSDEWNQAGTVHRNMRRALQVASIGPDVDRMVEGLGLVATPSGDCIDVILKLESSERLPAILGYMGHQTHPRIVLTIVVERSQIDRSQVTELAAEADVGAIEIIEVHEEETAQAVLASALSVVESEHVAFIHDSDYYGPDYLTDLSYSLGFSGSDVVGKRAHIAYVTERDETIYQEGEYEHRFTDTVYPGTVLTRREVLEAADGRTLLREPGLAKSYVPIPADARIYSADRWNYMRVLRGSTVPGGHLVCAGSDLDLVTA